MQKLYSSLIGLPVFDESSGTSVALVRDVLVDPASGNVLAFLVGNRKIIVPFDIEHINSGIFIADRDRIISPDDVLRVKQLSRSNIHIIGAKVITEMQKIYLGRVVDYQIDTTQMKLAKLYAAKSFLFFHYQERIVSAKNIIKIAGNVITIRDTNLTPDSVRAEPSAYAA